MLKFTPPPDTALWASEPLCFDGYGTGAWLAYISHDGRPYVWMPETSISRWQCVSDIPLGEAVLRAWGLHLHEKLIKLEALK